MGIFGSCPNTGSQGIVKIIYPLIEGFRQAPMGTVDRVNGHPVDHVWHFPILDSFARKNPFRMVVLGSQTSI